MQFSWVKFYLKLWFQFKCKGWLLNCKNGNRLRVFGVSRNESCSVIWSVNTEICLWITSVRAESSMVRFSVKMSVLLYDESAELVKGSEGPLFADNSWTSADHFVDYKSNVMYDWLRRAIISFLSQHHFPVAFVFLRKFALWENLLLYFIRNNANKVIRSLEGRKKACRCVVAIR